MHGYAVILHLISEIFLITLRSPDDNVGGGVKLELIKVRNLMH